MANHFTDERWSDYVRNLLPDDAAAAMRQHLDEGCEACREAHRLWRSVAGTAGSEVRNQIPESLLHMSAAAYDAWRQLHIIPRRARMAHLVSDSLLAPLPLGVRSETSGHRRILGRVGQWSFDLRFEPSAGRQIFLTGQILGSGKHPAAPAGLVILLMSTDALLAKTEANQFGEFHLQFVRADGLRIFVDIPGIRPIGIALPDLNSPPPAADPAPD
jgi:anti-sigma factor RsiW